MMVGGAGNKAVLEAGNYSSSVLHGVVRGGLLTSLGWRAVSHQDGHYAGPTLVFSSWALIGYVFGYPMLSE